MNGGKTVEGRTGMEYITNGLSGEQLEDHMNSMMYEYEDEVVYAAFDLRADWVTDSNNPNSLAMEKYVAEFLELDYVHYNSKINSMAILTKEQKEAIIAIYDVTQRLLSAKKVHHVIVYRGFSWSERPEWVNERLEEGQNIQIDEQRILSSWSFSDEIAKGFVSRNNFGFVVRAMMPIERIFAIIDITMESESVCVSFDKNEEFEVVFIKGGELNE
ncbi:hypothetical protein [Bacillus sp. REN16]|uniref:hypothetical protein n=1 Tax=Bacillus sp. REN16 TaxID=2887296 RepID=UPI001E31DCB5|nr:hypothetical protein [Bacillus sp. REN16]MCC3358198.1 hypothetical protein [Bacillus sp. REN16]